MRKAKVRFTALDGRGGSTLISGRNQVALDVLRKEIAAGKTEDRDLLRRGTHAGFPDRLRAEFGLAPVSTRWLAWPGTSSRSSGQLEP